MWLFRRWYAQEANYKMGRCLFLRLLQCQNIIFTCELYRSECKTAMDKIQEWTSIKVLLSQRIVANKNLSVFLRTVEVSALSMQELANFPPLKLAQFCFRSLSFKHVNTQDRTITWKNNCIFYFKGFFSKTHTTTTSNKKLFSPNSLLLNHIYP